MLSGPEAERCSEEDWYHPEWVGLEDVTEINLVPESAKKKLLKVIK